jgi:hypothetical protein
VLTTLNTDKDPLPLAGFTVFASDDDTEFSSWFNSDDVADWKMEIAGTAFPTYRPDQMTGVDPLIATGPTTSTGVVTIGPLAMDQLDGTLAHEFVHVAHIVQVEEVKDKKPEEKKKEEPKPAAPLLYPYSGPGYYHHPYPSQMVVCDEPSNCAVM